MLSGKNQGSVQPYAYGSLLQAATYGATVPTVFGRTQSPLLAIWTANLRQGGSAKKFKQMKKGVTAYCENIDFLLGHNPIPGVLQMWNNSTKYPLTFTTYTTTVSGSTGYVDLPSTHFYAVIGVSITESYSASFDDYGATAPVSASGSYEVPLWNELFAGPDPAHGSAVRNYPYCYRWKSDYGNRVYLDSLALGGKTVTFYYAQLAASIQYQTPLAKNRLHFEPVLGDGDEYDGFFPDGTTPLSSQQILYPMFAGIGSASIDLGSGGVIPQIQAEVQGKFGLYSSGDADFADMIEDIFKSGVAQAFIGSSSVPQPSFTRVEHGLSCYRFPGCIQRKVVLSAGGQQNVIEYNLATTAGNWLLVLASNELGTSATLSIADTAANTWIPIFANGNCRQAWYAQAVGGASTVTISGFNANGTQVSVFEISGVDALDSVAVGTAGAAGLTTTNAQGFAAYVLGIGFWTTASSPLDPGIAHWSPVLDAATSIYGASSQYHLVLERGLKVPAAVNLALPNAPADMCLLAFKATNPANYPSPVGDFLDTDSLDWTRQQCRANGLWGSLSMSSQQAASDWLKQLYQAANAAPAFTGFKLFSMPYSEVSAVGHGAVYTAPTAAGPLFNLSTENGDFIASGNTAPIKVTTAARVNQPNVLQMQCLNRDSDYAPAVVAQPEAASIALYGLRKADAIQNYAVQDVSVARPLLGIQARRAQYGGDLYKFTLPAKWCLLAPSGAGGSSGFIDAPALPRPTVPGESVAWSFAGGASAYGGGGPYGPSIWTGGKIMILTASAWGSGATLTMTTGAPIFVPNHVGAEWSGYQIPPGIPKGATITGVYPMQVSVGDGGASGIGITVPAGASFGSNIGTDPRVVQITAGLTQTLEGAGPSFFNVSFLGLAVYYMGPGDATADSGYVPGSFKAPDSVITITDPLADINKIPVRITKMTENSDLTLDCEAEPFVYGMNAPLPLTTDSPTPFTPSTGDGAGSINAPVMFEATPRLSGQSTQDQLWIAVSSSHTNYGGSQGYISTDGGASYAPIGNPLVGSATTGISTADWAAASDPDTTHDLLLDLTESNGSLLSYSAAARDGFQYPCYIAGGGAYSVPYEIFSYNTATLTGTSLYTLKATGTGNELRRGVYAAPSPGVGVDHPLGSRFAFLDPGGQGILKINVDPAWIGKTLYFKFPTFNTFGSASQSLSDATAYPYTITGAPGGVGPGSGGFLVNGL